MKKWLGRFFVKAASFSMPFFLHPLTRSVALSRPRLKHQPALRGAFWRSLPQGGLEARLFREQGDRRMRGKQSSKKKHMKTTSQKKSNRLSQESKQSQQVVSTTNTAPQAVSTAAAERQDTRLPIDSEARKHNRTLPTEQVLALLQIQDRRLWEMAEVVGKWIWVSFTESPAAEVRQTLAQLGFHWNRTRQSWQHPCGQFRLSSSGDPREKYPAHHPADIRTN